MTAVGNSASRGRVQHFGLALKLGLLVLLLPLGSAPVAAHRLNLTTTDMRWQADGQVLDVIHRVHLDDALALLAQLGAADGLLDLDASARLLNYVEANFSLRSKAGELALEPWGAHIQGNQLFIYQRVPLATAPAALEVHNSLLHGVQTGIRNQVNLRVGDVVRSYEGAAEGGSTGREGAAIGWLVVAQPG